jgi:hypothetical protein
MSDDSDGTTGGEEVVAVLDEIDLDELSEILTELLVEAVDAEQEE